MTARDNEAITVGRDAPRQCEQAAEHKLAESLLCNSGKYGLGRSLPKHKRGLGRRQPIQPNPIRPNTGGIRRLLGPKRVAEACFGPWWTVKS